VSRITIRKAGVEDSALLLRFVRELAKYEKAEHEVTATREDIEHSMFAGNTQVHGLICELGSEAIGYAVYFYNYSTWLGRPGLYLEDLYVTPGQRGQGAGRAMLEHLAAIAIASNCARFEWSVLDWNTPAIEFYEKLGARPKSEWVGYQIAGQALIDLAEGR